MTAEVACDIPMPLNQQESGRTEKAQNLGKSAGRVSRKRIAAQK
jgi:hypothetical protein